MVIPTVRVLHVSPPIIVKTDCSNFRTVVQALTGNSSKPELISELCLSAAPSSNVNADSTVASYHRELAKDGNEIRHSLDSDCNAGHLNDACNGMVDQGRLLAVYNGMVDQDRLLAMYNGMVDQDRLLIASDDVMNMMGTNGALNSSSSSTLDGNEASTSLQEPWSLVTPWKLQKTEMGSNKSRTRPRKRMKEDDSFSRGLENDFASLVGDLMQQLNRQEEINDHHGSLTPLLFSAWEDDVGLIL